jgi:hypothetical protein
VYAILQHAGDFTAAATQLAKEGYGEPPQASKSGRSPQRRSQGQDDADEGLVKRLADVKVDWSHGKASIRLSASFEPVWFDL